MMHRSGFGGGFCQIAEVPATYNRILHRTSTDAQAALEDAEREARNEGLREALAKIESHIEMVSSDSPTRFALDWVRDDILALIEDTDDE